MKLKKIKSSLEYSKRILVLFPITDEDIGLRIYNWDKEHCLSIQVKLSDLENLLRKVGERRTKW